MLGVRGDVRNRPVHGFLVHGLLDRHDGAGAHGHGQHHLHIVGVGRLSDRGTLSPMNPLISEFQIPIENVLENMHVIGSSQVGVGVAREG